MNHNAQYYTKFRTDNPVTLEISRVTPAPDRKKGEVLLTFSDMEVAQSLPENLGNYYSWMGMQTKKSILKANTN